MAWVIVLLFCVVVWGLIAAVVANAAEDDKGKAKTQPGENTQLVNIQKIKKLDLNDKQKKFIESLIEKPDKKQE